MRINADPINADRCRTDQCWSILIRFFGCFSIQIIISLSIDFFLSKHHSVCVACMCNHVIFHLTHVWQLSCRVEVLHTLLAIVHSLGIAHMACNIHSSCAWQLHVKGFPLSKNIQLLQSNQWNYGQHFMAISLHPFNQMITKVACPFLNTHLKDFFEYLAYMVSYGHFILSIFPLISL